ncbi:MAG: hypothetical protein MUF12_00985 [Sediminibacterium sp.]|jgi:hypothetical protein|nr:hypothetical protein [Sediminibacterium sp.]
MDFIQTIKEFANGSFCSTTDEPQVQYNVLNHKLVLLRNLSIDLRAKQPQNEWSLFAIQLVDECTVVISNQLSSLPDLTVPDKPKTEGVYETLSPKNQGL